VTLWGLYIAGARCWHVHHRGGQRALPQAPPHPPRCVGIKLSTEVHYEKLSVDAYVLVGGRALPITTSRTAPSTTRSWYNITDLLGASCQPRCSHEVWFNAFSSFLYFFSHNGDEAIVFLIWYVDVEVSVSHLA
jgi:hypothetical protein